MPPTPRILLRDVGLLLHVPGVLAVPCLVVALVTGEYALLAPLAVTVALSVGLGQAGYWARPDDSSDDAEAPGAVRLGALAIAWLLAAAIAAVPFTWAAHVGVTAQAVASYGSPLNAFFEAVSGLTGTGLTTSSDPSQLPHTLQFWRSALEWAGGIGIVLLAALVIHPAASLKPLFQNELHVGMPQDTRTPELARRLLLIYGGLTAASVIAFWIAGMPAWEALNHGITALSTGGFAVTPDSFASYGPAIKLVGVFVILLGATSFAVHHRLLVQRDARALQTPQFVLFVGLALAGALAAAALDWTYGGAPTVTDALFNAISALGTCGLNSVAYSVWHPTIPPLLIIAMVLGAQLGSTGGGLKLERVVQVARGVRRGFRRTAPPGGTEGRSDPDRSALRDDRDELKRFWQAAVVVLIYLVTLALGTVALAVSTGGALPFLDVFFEAASALGNVGLSSGVTGPDLVPAGRLVLIALMWAGRLELLALVVLLLLPVAPADRLTIPDTPAPSLTPTERPD